MPPSIERKLRIQFQKGIRTNNVTNALLDPVPSAPVQEPFERDEICVVRVSLEPGGQYWFTDRRILHEYQNVRELVRYRAVKRVHWMFKDAFKGKGSVAEARNLKLKYHGRLELETEHGLVVLEGLGQAYLPLFNFFRWIKLE